MHVNRQPSLKYFSDNFSIEKFTTKNTNANQWMEDFEQECERLGVTTDEKKIEVLRMFVDKTCIDWYNSTKIQLDIEAEWETWKTEFSDIFAQNGWSPITYGLRFRYKEGSLMGYAMKKQQFLLNINRKIDATTMAYEIANGLPDFILNKIDLQKIHIAKDLLMEMRKYEHMVEKK
ncbi:hypothetical protein PV326_012913 [Microctonus aethiopoides]|nr:hypothetical protein PV326_012913 [Microctonus aethiopoides]